jgi:glycosyltransferase involved in cell wall biosynthesis
MNVALLTTVPQSLQFLRGHVQFLRGKGVEVFVVSSPGPALDAFGQEHGVPTGGVPMKRRIAPLADLVALWRLVRLLRRVRPDIVHAHTPKASLLGMLAARLAGVPIRMHHIHGLPAMTTSGPKRWLLKTCDALTCRLADEVYCVSHSLSQVVARQRICPAAKLRVLENGTIDGIDAEHRFNPSRFTSDMRRAQRRVLNIPDDAQVVGFVGRLVKDKGVDELLEAFAALSRKFPALHLLVVGPHERHQRLSARAAAALRGDARIRTVGYCEDPAQYYAVMDVLAFPTHREGFGLVAAEAAAMELPVVATQIPGCVDAVQHGVTGTLVPPRDAAALSEAIAIYLSDPDLRRRHGVAGRRRVQQLFRPQPIHEALWRRYPLWASRLLRPNAREHRVNCPQVHEQRAIPGKCTDRLESFGVVVKTVAAES